MGDEQDAVARIDRLFATLGELRREASKVEDELELFSRACRLAVEHGKCRFAWVGVVSGSGILPVVHAGEGADYLDDFAVTTGTSPTGRGPTGTAVRERRAVFCTDIATDESMAPWRERALAHGFRSSGAFPIERGNGVYAALTLYAPTVGFAEPVEQAIASAIATEVGAALDAHDRERERRAAEARVRASEELYRALVDGAADGIFLAAADHRFLEANAAACELVGYSRAELLELRLEDVIAPDELARQPIDLKRFEPGVGFTAERCLLHKDGRRIDVEIRGMQLHDGRLQSVVRDVTERKRAQALRAANDRVVSLGRLAQSVGHEINNPLAYLMLSLEQVRTHASTLPQAQRGACEEALAAVADGASRIAHIVRALSAFGRGDTEALGPVSLERAVSAAVTLTRNRVQHVGAVEVAVEGAPTVRANEFGLTQVLVNLLLNAADAMEGGDHQRHVVKVSYSLDDADAVVLEVADSGPGVPPEDLERIFEPLYTTKAVGRGTGLGLSIARGMVAAFGGTLEAHNRDGGGALFRVILPRAESRAPEPSSEACASTQRRRVLVVDDEPLVARSIALALDGHDVTTCARVDLAVELCQETDYDCILCDLMMPRGGGPDLHERLGRTKPNLVPKIVFMTGGAFTESSARFLESIPNPCITKPFRVETLLEAIEVAARNGPPAAAPARSARSEGAS
jgi:PAS domain S-box-containing protein